MCFIIYCENLTEKPTFAYFRESFRKMFLNFRLFLQVIIAKMDSSDIVFVLTLSRAGSHCYQILFLLFKGKLTNASVSLQLINPLPPLLEGGGGARVETKMYFNHFLRKPY